MSTLDFKQQPVRAGLCLIAIPAQPQFTGQNLANTSWSEAYRFLWDCLQHRPPEFNHFHLALQFQQQNLANTAWPLSCCNWEEWPLPDRNEVDRIRQCLADCFLQVSSGYPAFHAKHVTGSAWALSVCLWFNIPRHRVMLGSTAVLVFCADAGTALEDCDPSELTCFAWPFACQEFVDNHT